MTRKNNYLQLTHTHSPIGPQLHMITESGLKKKISVTGSIVCYISSH